MPIDDERWWLWFGPDRRLQTAFATRGVGTEGRGTRILTEIARDIAVAAGRASRVSHEGRETNRSKQTGSVACVERAARNGPMITAAG